MENKIQEIINISKPLVEYIKENYNPHTAIIITNNHIKVVSEEINVPIKAITLNPLENPRQGLLKF